MDGADEDTTVCGTFHIHSFCDVIHHSELMKTPRYQRAAGEHDKLEREFRRLLDEKLGRKYLELDDALFRVMDDIAEAMYMKGAADRELMIR